MSPSSSESDSDKPTATRFLLVKIWDNFIPGEFSEGSDKSNFTGLGQYS